MIFYGTTVQYIYSDDMFGLATVKDLSRSTWSWTHWLNRFIHSVFSSGVLADKIIVPSSVASWKACLAPSK